MLSTLALLVSDLAYSEEAKLVHPDVALQDNYGTDVALDGEWLAVGSVEDQGNPDTGRIYLWRRSGASWSSEQILIPLGLPVGREWGQLLALEDGVIAGVHQWKTGLPEPELTIFTLLPSGASWAEEASIVPSLPPNMTDLPRITDIDMSGDLLVIGFPDLLDPNGVQTGALYVYERQAGDWSSTSETVLFASGALQGDQVGASVATSAGAVACGSPGFDLTPALVDAGRVLVFERPVAAWTETAALIGTFPDYNDRLGQSLALDQGILAAGAPQDTLPPGNREGAVETWSQGPSTGAWPHLAKVRALVPMDQEEFGHAVSLDNGRLGVGTFRAPGGGLRGAAWLFTLYDGVWTHQQKVIPSDATAQMKFGAVVSVSGGRMAVGAPGDDQPSGNMSGSAYVLRFAAPAPTLYCTAKASSAGCTAEIGTTGESTWTGADDFVVTATDVAPGKTGLFFYGTSGPIDVPFFGGTLCVSPPLTRSLPQAASAGPGACGGSYGQPLSQALFEAEGLAPADELWGQWWLRDPQNPDGTGVALSNAVRITVGS